VLDLLLAAPVRPSWRWQFTAGALPEGGVFTRGSAGWSFNGAGSLVQSPADSPRYDYDAVTLAPYGLLCEMQSTNLLLQSQTLASAPWTVSSLALTAASGTAPDGSNTLFKAVEGAAANVHELSQQVSGTLPDTYYGLSFFVKAGARNFIYLRLGASTGNWATAVFDLQNGVAGETATGASSGTVFRTDMRPVGGGIWRLQMIAKCAGTALFAACGLATAASGNSFTGSGGVQYAGDGTSHAFLWGGQLDSPGIGVTSYIPTAGATVTRSADQLVMPISFLRGFDLALGGVWVATYRLHTVVPGGVSQNPLYVTDGGLNTVDMRAQSGTQAGALVMGSLVRAGSYVINVNGGPRANPLVRRRQAFGYGPSRGVIAHDGIFDIGTVSLGGLPAGLNSVYLGGDGTTAQLNGTMESVAFYPGARSDSFIMRVSR
jgi:hypothetical protein